MFCVHETNEFPYELYCLMQNLLAKNPRKAPDDLDAIWYVRYILDTALAPS